MCDHFRPHDRELLPAGDRYTLREPNRGSCDRRGPMGMNSGDFGHFKPTDMDIPPDRRDFDHYEPPHPPAEFNHWEPGHPQVDFRSARFAERPGFHSEEYRRDVCGPGNVEPSHGPPSEQFGREFPPPYLCNDPQEHNRRYSPPLMSKYRDNRGYHPPPPPSPPPGLREERLSRRFDEDVDYPIRGHQEHMDDRYEGLPLLGRCPEDVSDHLLRERCPEECNGSRENDIHSRDGPR